MTRHGTARRLHRGCGLSSSFALALLLVSVAAPITMLRAQEESETDSGFPLLTLEDAVRLARTRAPSMQVANQGLEVAEARALEAILLRLPTLTGRATISPSGPIRGNAIASPNRTDIAAVADIFDEFGYQLRTEIRAVQPIYTFGKISLADDLAEIGLAAADMQWRKAELETVFQVTRAYLGRQLSETLDELIEDGQSRLADAREELENRLFDGDSTARTELRRLTIEEAALVGRITENRMLGELSRLGLQYLCDIEGGFEVSPLDDGAEPLALMSLDEILEIAAENRPDYDLLNRAIEASSVAARLAWRQLVPDLFFAAGFGLNYNPLADDQPSSFANDPYNSSGIGFFLGLDWQWDSRQVSQARVADAETDQVRARREQVVGGIEVEIAEAYLTAQGQDERVAAYDAAVDAAQAWLRQRTMQFDSGLTGFEELSDPLLAYFRVSVEYHAAVFESRLARANLALKIGLDRLEPGLGLAAPTEQEEADPEEADQEEVAE